MEPPVSAWLAGATPMKARHRRHATTSGNHTDSKTPGSGLATFHGDARQIQSKGRRLCMLRSLVDGLTTSVRQHGRTTDLPLTRRMPSCARVPVCFKSRWPWHRRTRLGSRHDAYPANAHPPRVGATSDASEARTRGSMPIHVPTWAPTPVGVPHNGQSSRVSHPNTRRVISTAPRCVWTSKPASAILAVDASCQAKRAAL